MGKHAISGALLAALIAAPVSSESKGPVYVFTENESDEHRSCSFSYTSAASAAKAALRYNRIPISDTEGGMYLYINVSAMNIDAGGQETGYCVYSITLKFISYGISMNYMTEKNAFATHEWCNESNLLLWNKYQAQNQVNTTIKESVDTCLTEILTN